MCTHTKRERDRECQSVYIVQENNKAIGPEFLSVTVSIEKPSRLSPGRYTFGDAISSIQRACMLTELKVTVY